MARKSKNQAPIVVLPTPAPTVQVDDVQATPADVPTPAHPIDPAPDAQATDATTPAESSNLDATDATPAPVKPFDTGLPTASHTDSAIKPDPSVNADNATTPAPLPCVVVPNIQAPAPYTPKLTAPSVVKAEAYVIDVARILNVANADILGWGRFIQDIMMTERENSTRFGADEFDATIRELGALYTDRFPHSEATPRVQNHWDYAEFMDVCTTLGIIGAERIAYGRVVNRLHPATCDRVKDSATTIVKDGWADWLRAIGPVIIRTDNPLSDDTIIASIDAQRVALNALDPKKYPLPRKRTTKEARQNRSTVSVCMLLQFISWRTHSLRSSKRSTSLSNRSWMSGLAASGPPWRLDRSAGAVSSGSPRPPGSHGPLSERA